MDMDDDPDAPRNVSFSTSADFEGGVFENWDSTSVSSAPRTRRSRKVMNVLSPV